MIEKRTVLVLGAGASMDFGFPSGRELLQHVIAELGSPPGQLFRILLSIGNDNPFLSEPLLEGFRTALIRARPPSIDVLVEGRREFLALGKAAIACGLMPCETKGDLLFPAIGPPSWYDHLLGRLTDGGRDSFQRNQLAIVTFNYDRSLEYFLFTALKHRWKLADPECVELMKAIPIVHVYGQLGKLPELSESGGRPYGGALDGGTVAQSVAEMQILHEGASSPNLKDAQERLKSADRVCFLGFGYHPTNLERLRVKDLAGQAIVGSACGLEDGERHLALQSFGNVRIELGGIDQDARSYLRKSRILN